MITNIHLKYKCLLVLFSIVSFNSTANVKNKVELNLNEIKSLKKSSRIGYEDDFLFVGKVRDTLKRGNLNIRKGDFIEVLANKNICYDEVRLSFLASKKTLLSITNINIQKIIKVAEGKDYRWFLKILVNTDNGRKSAGCSISYLK
jgi:hypothetical protein